MNAVHREVLVAIFQVLLILAIFQFILLNPSSVFYVENTEVFMHLREAQKKNGLL